MCWCAHSLDLTPPPPGGSTSPHCWLPAGARCSACCRLCCTSSGCDGALPPPPPGTDLSESVCLCFTVEWWQEMFWKSPDVQNSPDVLETHPQVLYKILKSTCFNEVKKVKGPVVTVYSSLSRWQEQRGQSPLTWGPVKTTWRSHTHTGAAGTFTIMKRSQASRTCHLSRITPCWHLHAWQIECLNEQFYSLMLHL